MMPTLSQEQKWPDHVSNLISNTKEVGNLIELHTMIIGGKRGRPKNLEVLNKSAVVLLVACWEAYVEDLASNSFDFLLANAISPDTFPSKVLATASRPLRKDQDEREVWKLAGEGWKDVLSRHRQQVFDRYIGRLNTPRPSNVDLLFENLIGFGKLSKLWKWQGVSNKSAINKLDRLITLRGEISHRVNTSRSVRRRYVERSTGFTNRLAAISLNAVRKFLETRTNIDPWIVVSYGKTG
jgi:hypothetical protein